MKNNYLYLECILSDQEKLVYSKDLGENITLKSRSEEALKSFQTQKKAEISGHEAKINLLADKINTGREYREVECDLKFDWEEKTKSWVRKDTGEVAKVEEMTDDEIDKYAQHNLTLDTVMPA